MKLSEFLVSYKKSVLWKSFNGGNYNLLAVTDEKVLIEQYNHYWVRKKPKIRLGEILPLNSVDRAVRKYYELNPGSIAFKDGTQAWFLPFFGSSPSQDLEFATDMETACAVVDIYQRTGNIVADAAIAGNFLFDKGDIVCVDVDLANRRGSISSDNYFNDTIATSEFDSFFNIELKKVEAKFQRPITANYIKILFYLDECLAKFSGNHQMLEMYMMPMIFDFCVQQVAITESVFHNLKVLISDERYIKIPEEWLRPSLFCKAKPALDFKELFLSLKANYKASKAEKMMLISEEQEVANVLNEMLDTIDKEMTFDYSFFANLPKRPIEYALNSEDKVDACLKSVRKNA